MIKKVCLICKKEFFVFPCLDRIKCCSRLCSNKSRKEYRPTKTTKIKISLSMKGKLPKNINLFIEKGRLSNIGLKEEKAHNWKGDNVGMGGIHDWIRRKLGRPQKCFVCGGDNLLYKKIHWHNISGEYKREIKDWVRLCASCHLLVDRYGKTELLKIDELIK